MIKFNKYGNWRCPKCKSRNHKHKRICLIGSKLYYCDCGFKEEIVDSMSEALGVFISQQKENETNNKK